MARATKTAENKVKTTATRASKRANKIAKTQIIQMVAERTSLNKEQAAEAVACVLENIISALQSGKSVGLPGLGILSVTQTAARQGVRPGTSERIAIPAGKKIRFKLATTLKGHL
ncbi:HU family DNA-binding protein [Deinococcus sp.]|uniref:HU family DNA-binding protein n=1 Tax=Deinococcus sp. TaxID=47478 RepID=UPI0025B99ADE|nr:HU family DNA-binding protein [Deinococcus sp.]